MDSLVFLAISMVAVSSDTVVQTGYRHTCVLKNHAVRCWGENNHGQLGLGHTTNLGSPQDEPVDLGDDFLPDKIGCGHYHCCVASTTGGLRCFGRNHKGQLGYGDTNNRGDESGEMGNNLPLVDLPSDFVIEQVVSANYAVCLLSVSGNVLCFGAGAVLGVGASDDIGISDDQMGDFLSATDLGSDFVAVGLYPGYDHVCAVSSGGQIKCWGSGTNGRTGHGNTEYIGDDADEMGDFLAVTDVGTEFSVLTMDCTRGHCCAVSTTKAVKCWGRGDYGQLGLGSGDQKDHGDGANEMGDWLPFVDVGSDFVVQQVQTSGDGSCVVSTKNVLRCWGCSDTAQLALSGIKVWNTGSESNDVDIGTGFASSGLHVAGGTGYHHRCIFDDSPDFCIKCYGSGSNKVWGGPDPDNQDCIAFDDWPALPTSSPTVPPPTSEPTVDPTTEPTVDPTSEPTVDPTSEPTANPTSDPTADCGCDDEINSVKGNLTSLQIKVAELDNILRNGRLGWVVNSAVDDQGSNMDESESGMGVWVFATGKELGIAVLAAINVLTVIAVVIACKRSSGWTKYQPVAMDSDIEPINA